MAPFRTIQFVTLFQFCLNLCMHPQKEKGMLEHWKWAIWCCVFTFSFRNAILRSLIFIFIFVANDHFMCVAMKGIRSTNYFAIDVRTKGNVNGSERDRQIAKRVRPHLLINIQNFTTRSFRFFFVFCASATGIHESCVVRSTYNYMRRASW